MSTSSVIAIGSPCVVCKRGTIQRGKKLLVYTYAFLECDSCHVEYHRRQDSLELRKVPSQYEVWSKYVGQELTESELLRIAQGGKSNAEIARDEQQQKALEQARMEKEERARRADEERHHLEQTPGTLQNYHARFCTTLGHSPDDTDLNVQVSWSSENEGRQQIKRLTQMQKELRQIKKDINLTIKTIRAQYADSKAHVKANDLTVFWSGANSRAASRQRAAQRENLRDQQENELKPFQAIVSMIDSTVVQLDALKIDVDKKITEPFSGETKQDTPKIERQAAKQETEETTTKGISVDKLLQELDEMVGLDDVKSEVVELINFLKIQRVRKSKGMAQTPISLHVVFYGNPGTGKTSIARVLSRLYQSLGVLSKGHLIETDRAGLVAGYVGQTALKVKESVTSALGGTLFIDEAYSLADESERSFGAEAVDTLLKLMEDNRNDLAVVMAGYTDRMENFLASNPGLKSRFNRFWRFEDYKPEQLVAIFDRFCTKQSFRLSDPARDKLSRVFRSAYEQRTETFGNARLARNLFESAISNQANRLVMINDPTEQALAFLEAADIPDDWTTL